MNKRKAKKNKPQVKKKISLGSQLMVASTIFWAGNTYIISQVDTDTNENREAITIKAVRFFPIYS